jgi:hypothetical protein
MASCWTRKGKAADGNDQRTKAFIIHANGRQKEMCQLQGTEAKSSTKVNSDYRRMPAREVLMTMQNGSFYDSLNRGREFTGSVVKGQKGRVDQGPRQPREDGGPGTLRAAFAVREGRRDRKD